MLAFHVQSGHCCHTAVSGVCPGELICTPFSVAHIWHTPDGSLPDSPIDHKSPGGFHTQ